MQHTSKGSASGVAMKIQGDQDTEPAAMGRCPYRLKRRTNCCLDSVHIPMFQGFEMNPHLSEISILILAFKEEVKLLL